MTIGYKVTIYAADEQEMAAVLAAISESEAGGNTIDSVQLEPLFSGVEL